MKRRILSIITALALCLSLCPTWAWAAEEEPCQPHGLYGCAVCPIEDMIAALPDTVTEDNAADARAQLDHILDLCRELTEDEQDQLDISRITGLQRALDPANAPVMAADEGTVSTLEELTAAFTAASGGSTVSVQLGGDITADSTLTLSGGNLTLDLNGHTLSSAEQVVLVSGGTFTLEDRSSSGSGSIEETGSKIAIYVNGGDAIINNGTVANNGSYTIDVLNGTLTVNDGTIHNANGSAIYVYLNASVVVSGGNIISDNGNAIYVVHDTASLTVSGETTRISGGGGYGGIYAQYARSIQIEGGTIEGTGSASRGLRIGEVDTVALSGGTFSGTSRSINIENSSNYSTVGSLLKPAESTGDHWAYQKDGSAINSGLDNKYLSNTVTVGKCDGTFGTPTPDSDTLTHSKTCGTCGYTLTEDCTFGDYTLNDSGKTHTQTCTVCNRSETEPHRPPDAGSNRCSCGAELVAEIQKTGSPTTYVTSSGIKDVFYAQSGNNGATIKLLDSVETSLSVFISCTLNLNGHNIRWDSTGACISVTSGETMTIQGEGQVSSKVSFALDVAGTAVLQGGTYVGGHSVYDGQQPAINVWPNTLATLLGHTDTTRYAYYDGEADSTTLITAGLDGNELSGTVTVKPCNHTGEGVCAYTHIDNTSIHTKTCLACGQTWDAEDCEYGTEYTHDDTNHTQTCEVCGGKKVEAHTLGLTAEAIGNTVTLNGGCSTKGCGYQTPLGTASFTFPKVTYGQSGDVTCTWNGPRGYYGLIEVVVGIENQFGKNEDENIVEGSWTLAQLFGSTKVTAGGHKLKVSFFSDALVRSNACELDFTIDPAPLTPSITGTATKTFDGTKDCDGTGLSIALDGVVGSDDVTATAASYAYDSPNAGERTITAIGITLGGADAGNYTLSSATATTTGTITKATPILTVPTAGAIQYGQKLSASILSGGTAVNGSENVDGTWSWADGDTRPTATGNFSVAFVPSDTANYNTPENVDINVTVNAAAPKVILTATPSSQIAGGVVNVNCTVENPHDAAFTADIPSAALTYQIGDGEAQTVTDGKFTVPEGTEAGTVITITAATAAVDGKYTAATQTATVTVTEKTPVIITGISVAGQVYNGQPVRYTGVPVVKTEDGTAVSDVPVTYTWSSGTAPVNAGDYSLVIAVSSDKYTGSTKVDFTIDKASITIKADNKSADTGSAKPNLTYTATGLVSGEKLAVEPTLACDADMSKAGSYPITASGAAVPSSGNYNEDINYVEGTLTVSTPYVPPTPPETPVTGVRLNRSTVRLKPGEGFRLTAAVEPSNATRKDVTWSSSNPTVAEVDGNGSVIARTPGTAVITVRTVSGGYTATCTVTVEAPEPKHVHDWDSAWHGDSAHHWHECLADGCDITVDSEKDGYGEHVYDDEQDTTCNVCGYVREVEPPQPEHVHDWDSAWNRANGYHWHECLAGGCDIAVDSKKDGYGEHIYDDEQDTTCNVCGYVREVEPPQPETYTIMYNANGGTGTMAAGTAMKDVPFVLPVCGFTAPAGKVFDCWHIGGTSGISVKPGEQYTFTANTVVWAVWKDTPAEPEYAITGNVLQNGAGVPDAIVTLMRGIQTVATERTDANGHFTFSGVPVGTYNLKAEKDGITKTVKQEITSGNADMTIILPNGRTNSVVEVKNEETPPVVVGGLDQVFTDPSVYTPEDQETVNNGGTVEFKLTVEKQDAPPEAVKIETVKKENETVALYLDLTLTKTITHSDGTGTNAEVPEVRTLIETIVPLPAEMQGKASYTVYRVHNGVAEPLPENSGSEYYMVSSDKTSISIFARKYSTYAIAWSDKAETPPIPPTPPTPSRPTGGSGSSVRTYAVTVEKSEHGTVTASRVNAASGTTVTLTVTPDTGYVLLDLTVTDSQGNPIRVTDQNTFTMPSRAVTVKASFAPVPDESQEKPCDGGADCPSRAYADLSTGTWYHEAVDYAIREGLLIGYGNGVFNPDGNLSRAMLAQILYNKAGRPGVNGGSSFMDVAPDSWYADAIIWAVAQGIVGGYGNGKFGPNDPITREQLAVMLWRYSKEPAATDKELHFSDADQASSWALEALRWAAENGVLNGYGDGRLGPQGQATRAQTAQMLKNFLESQEERT